MRNLRYSPLGEFGFSYRWLQSTIDAISLQIENHDGKNKNPSREDLQELLSEFREDIAHLIANSTA